MRTTIKNTIKNIYLLIFNFWSNIRFCIVLLNEKCIFYLDLILAHCVFISNCCLMVIRSFYLIVSAYARHRGCLE